MVIDLSSRRLEQEVDSIICGALRAGLGSQIIVSMQGHFNKAFTVDRIMVDDHGFPSEVWLSADARRSVVDALLGQQRRDLLRVSRMGGDVRRSLSTVAISRNNNVRHLTFREEVGAPRISRSVATFNYPRPDCADWLLTYARAS